ncbi:hypothetical protein [Microcoleus sp. OTE_8_concoct_300]|uniref:hypothetical protein n=1 Tax=Microcoleus sp. OTE_8_concoct_300 TaxID=2964710 RepID=UPI00403F0D3F
MVSPQINIAGLHKVADFRFNQHHKVVSVIKKMTHQLEFYVYQGKFTLYVLPEDIEAAKVLLGIPIE